MADNPIFPTTVQGSPNLSKIPRKTKKISSFFFFISSFFLSLLLSFSWVNAKEAPKPKPQDWQFEGIVAALDDQYPEVRQKAVEKLTNTTYKTCNLSNGRNLLRKPLTFSKMKKFPTMFAIL
ncbi:MAG: hypothetical protein VKL59_01980 [Nostocaceae cyanobacterium]|nr:hypothetical protein [Nostocaceae cyanobacterium]